VNGSKELNESQRASRPNPYAFGTSGMSAAEQPWMPEASRDRSLGTFGNKIMRPFLILASVAAVFIFCGAFLLWAMFSDQSSFSAGLSSFEDLPSTAKDISVYKNSNISGLQIMEFTIPESDFRDYAENHSWPLNEISDTQLVMSAMEYHNKKGNYYKEISSGLFFEKRQENGGGVTVAYDRGNQIAYVNRSSR